MDQNGNGVNGENPGDIFTGTVTITPAARPTVSVPFSDSFAGSFGASLGRQWLETNGYFLVQTPSGALENVAVAQSPGENRAILQLATTQRDVVVQANVDPGAPANNTAGLLARYIDANNFCLGQLQSLGGNSYAAQIFKVVGGTATLLSSASTMPMLGGTLGGGTLRFEVAGNSLKLFLNDVLVTFAEDASITNK